MSGDQFTTIGLFGAEVSGKPSICKTEIFVGRNVEFSVSRRGPCPRMIQVSRLTPDRRVLWSDLDRRLIMTFSMISARNKVLRGEFPNPSTHF